MNDDFLKTFAKVMDKIEKDSNNSIYAINQEVESKAQQLCLNLISMGIKPILEYNPAYMQIVVIAESYVLDIVSKDIKSSFFNSDVMCIDATSRGLIHIECAFNNAFIKVGELNE